MKKIEQTEDKPEDWDSDYQTTISGKELAAIEHLVEWTLDQVPPLSIIAASDCAFWFCKRARVGYEYEKSGIC